MTLTMMVAVPAIFSLVTLGILGYGLKYDRKPSRSLKVFIGVSALYFLVFFTRSDFPTSPAADKVAMFILAPIFLAWGVISGYLIFKIEAKMDRPDEDRGS